MLSPLGAATALSNYKEMCILEEQQRPLTLVLAGDRHTVVHLDACLVAPIAIHIHLASPLIVLSSLAVLTSPLLAASLAPVIGIEGSSSAALQVSAIGMGVPVPSLVTLIETGASYVV